MKNDFNPLIFNVANMGSWIAYFLAKNGFQNFTIIDPERITEKDVERGFYKPSQLGFNRVIALKDNIYEMTGVSPQWKLNEPQKIESNNVIILCYPDLKNRELLCEKLPSQTTKVFDVRIAPRGLVEIVIATSKEEYVKTLYEINSEGNNVKVEELYANPNVNLCINSSIRLINSLKETLKET